MVIEEISESEGPLGGWRTQRQSHLLIINHSEYCHAMCSCIGIAIALYVAIA